jgi:hypothetical protein
MKCNSKSKSLLALVLAIALAATGCSAQWINIALQDLPVLTQMALNIATLAGTFSRPQNTADLAVVQNISTQTSRDLNLLQSLYNEYKADPNDATLAKIQSAIVEINQNVPALLESAHVSNPLLAIRVNAAANLILGTINSFATLMPAHSSVKARKLVEPLPSAAELKSRWNQQVCAPAEGGAASAPELARCVLR